MKSRPTQVGTATLTNSHKTLQRIQVVAGLIPYPFQYRDSIGYYGKIKDYNNAVDSGIYELKGSGVSNEPPTSKMYGVLIVMKANDNIVQLSFHNDNDEVFSRLFVLGGWRAWTRLSNV